MKKKNLIIIVSIIVASVIFGIVFFIKIDQTELKSIKSEKELKKIYEGKTNEYEIADYARVILASPFFILEGIGDKFARNIDYDDVIYDNYTDSINSPTYGSESNLSILKNKKSSSKEYSTTNIQVENVDEADITKTDGDYIYSISENQVIITNVKNPEQPKIETKIASRDDAYPEDLILYNNNLAVISAKYNSSRYDSDDTVVEIYNIENKENAKLEKSYKLLESYYTSRCIGNKLYVIASGNLRKEDDKIITYYQENYSKKEIKLSDIKYLKDIKDKKQTLISMVNLDDISKDVNVSSYLIDISNAYVSQKNLYLLNDRYNYSNDNSEQKEMIKEMFGLKGILGLIDLNLGNSDYSGKATDIYKFNFKEDGTIEYDCKNNIEGETINQYSLDEYQGNLRIATYNNKGSQVIVFDDKLKVLGKTGYLAKGEKMYSTRFIGSKAYIVTYKTIDPLFVIDLSNPNNPKVLGELKIPGYSTYLHPYDETHIIGIGMETEEKINRNSNGKVVSTSARIIGMKMALFDVSDVENPVQVSNTIIGNKNTTSSILTNPKALLFSKEKELIAIPVNNYSEDFEVTSNSDTYESAISAYKNSSKSYIGEGYAVFKINLKDGFVKKGIITHEKQKKNVKNYYEYNYNASKLLRGMYIENNLYTVSEDMIKVNSIDDLKEVSELKIK